MYRTLLSSLAIVGLVFGIAIADDAEEAVKKDRKKIEGTWRAVSVEIGGTKMAEDEARKITVVNRADGSWTLFSEHKEVGKGTSTIDPSKKPKTIDLEITSDGTPKTHLGIYELGDKSRKLCFAPPDKPRPTEFASASGSEVILVTFERVEEKKP
jgi:uncharacterized protein (TIGR03067 family)